MARKVSNGRKISKRLVLGAVATATAAGVGLGSAVTAQAATGPFWAPAGPSAVSGAVTATASVHYAGSKTGEWAFVTTAFETNFKGFPSVYSRTNNESWGKATLPGSAPGEVFVSATAINNKDVLAFSNLPNNTGREWQFTGSTWKVIKTFDAPIGNASVTSATNVWVAGSAAASAQLGVLHYNGTTWSKSASTLHGVQGLSGSNVWAYTGTTVAHFNGTAWTGTNLASLIPGSSPRIVDVYDTDGTVYVVGNGGTSTVILAFNGKSWAKVGSAANAQALSNEVIADGDSGIWFLASAGGSGASEAVHYTRSVKTVGVSELPGKMMAITRVNSTNALAGGSVPSGKVNPATFAALEFYN